MIEINNLRVKYGLDIILDNISFSFNNQKIYGLIGKNGAGKTTLLKAICRLFTIPYNLYRGFTSIF